MRLLAGLIILIFFCGCAASAPPRPVFTTAAGEACAGDCQADYDSCMQNEIRPDYLVFSPRKKACGKMLRGCYDRCSEKEKQ